MATVNRIAAATLLGDFAGGETSPLPAVAGLRQRGQQVLDCHQTGNIGPDRLTQFRGQTPQRLIALSLSRLQHRAVGRGQAATSRERRLDDAPQPGLVQSHLLEVRAFARKGVRAVLVPEAPQPDVALRGLRNVQPPARSFPTSASATWLVPTELGSLRLSFMS